MLVFFHCMVLIVAMAWLTTGCSETTDREKPSAAGQEEKAQDQISSQNMGTDKAQDQISSENMGTDEIQDQISSQNMSTDRDQAQSSSQNTDINADIAAVLGEGDTFFSFIIVENEDGEIKETQFEIHTDKETVGEALLELELIDGEKSDYGLYVNTVNGITIDYKDGRYWAFYINDEYAQTGVDSTVIKNREEYSFRTQKS